MSPRGRVAEPGAHAVARPRHEPVSAPEGAPTARAGEEVDPTDLLATLLDRAARGDRTAFSRFYDATVRKVYAWEVCRARVLQRAEPTAVAAEATRRRYLDAWRRAADHRSQPLSPVAWMLTL
ncbi:hypothetical protein [Nocardioides stalactiti]|uniref:hypothetical protein n=1 Tax=Nocardioides stalactiti TaxID=2755356 RepID=UPI0015FFB46D|nr:hypothetical protein [Nocardioides stalactiti]